MAGPLTFLGSVDLGATADQVLYLGAGRFLVHAAGYAWTVNPVTGETGPHTFVGSAWQVGDGSTGNVFVVAQDLVVLSGGSGSGGTEQAWLVLADGTMTSAGTTDYDANASYWLQFDGNPGNEVVSKARDPGETFTRIVLDVATAAPSISASTVTDLPFVGSTGGIPWSDLYEVQAMRFLGTNKWLWSQLDTASKRAWGVWDAATSTNNIIEAAGGFHYMVPVTQLPDGGILAQYLTFTLITIDQWVVVHPDGTFTAITDDTNNGVLLGSRQGYRDTSPTWAYTWQGPSGLLACTVTSAGFTTKFAGFTPPEAGASAASFQVSDDGRYAYAVHPTQIWWAPLATEQPYLRMTQRGDGLGISPAPRLRAANSSHSSQSSIRVGGANTFI